MVNFLEIHRNIKVKDNDGGIGEYSVIIETKTVMQYRKMMNMYFKKNKAKKDIKIIKMKNAINCKSNYVYDINIIVTEFCHGQAALILLMVRNQK